MGALTTKAYSGSIVYLLRKGSGAYLYKRLLDENKPLSTLGYYHSLSGVSRNK